MEMMFGAKWDKEQTQLMNAFNVYTNYWDEHQDFVAMEKKRV